MMMKLTAIVCMALLACAAPVFGASERKQKISAAVSAEEQESRALDDDMMGDDLVSQRSYLAITPPNSFKTLFNAQSNPGM
jgi:type II secretory pathway pseudopilin PulG